ncbi:MAG: tyrosine-type recombinase/integrase [Acidobacteria bacterium]|nr:tyrosine-type recombinase/integrase [Acidobacteriota bacterium]
MTDRVRTSIAAAAPMVVADSGDAELIQLWIDSHRKSAKTRAQYRRVADRLCAWMAANTTALPRLTLRELLDFAETLADMAPNSQKAILSAVKSLLTFAQKTGYCQYNVGAALEVAKTKNTLAARILSEEQVLRMIAAEPDVQKQLIIRMLYATGGRVSELCGLTWRDAVANGDAGQLTLLGKGGVTRVVLLSRATWQVLSSSRPADASPDAPIVRSRTGKPLARSWIWGVVKAAAVRAGLPDGVSPHWMRHAHISHALDRGAPAHLVKATVGHASLETTSAYAHARPSDSSARYLPI